MKVSVLQENLLEGLQTVAPALARRGTLAVLSNVLLEAEAGQFRLVANRFDLAISTPVAAKIEEPGTVTVPGRLLLELMSNFPPERVDMEIEGERLKLRCANYTSTLNVILAEEFPMPPSIPDGGAFWKLEGEQLRDLVRRTAFAAEANESRPVMSGVMVEVTTETLMVVAMDGFRLSEVRTNGQSDLIPGKLIMPADGLVEVVKLINEDTEQILLYTISDRQVIFDVDGVVVVMQTIEGEFPAYQGLIKESVEQSELQAVVPVAALRRALKVGRLFAREESHRMVLWFDPETGMLRIAASSAHSGNSSIDVPCSIDGKEMEIGFDERYLADVVGVVEENMTIQAISPARGVMFGQVGDDGFRHLIMPMHLSEGR